MDDLVQDVLITATLLLDSKGDRIITKYYANPNSATKSTLSLEDQIKLEKALTVAASSSNVSNNEHDICMVDQFVAIFHVIDDVRLFVVVDISENETVAAMVLSTLHQSLTFLFDFRVNKVNILNSIDLVMFIIDECIDNGYILELDSEELIKRVSMQDKSDPNSSDSAKSFQQQDTSLSNALGMAAGAFLRAWK